MYDLPECSMARGKKRALLKQVPRALHIATLLQQHCICLIERAVPRLERHGLTKQRVSLLQCVAVCCGVSQCVAVCLSAMALWNSASRCCRMWQSDYCSVLQWVAACGNVFERRGLMKQHVCLMLCVAAYCRVTWSHQIAHLPVSVHKSRWKNIHIHTCMHIYINIQIDQYVFIYICVITYMYLHTCSLPRFLCLYVCLWLHIHIHIYIYACVCIYIHMYKYIYIYIPVRHCHVPTPAAPALATPTCFWGWHAPHAPAAWMPHLSSQPGRVCYVCM